MDLEINSSLSVSHSLRPFIDLGQGWIACFREKDLFETMIFGKLVFGKQSITIRHGQGYSAVSLDGESSLIEGLFATLIGSKWRGNLLFKPVAHSLPSTVPVEFRAKFSSGSK